jgi:hypothetical protein
MKFCQALNGVDADHDAYDALAEEVLPEGN